MFCLFYFFLLAAIWYCQLFCSLARSKTFVAQCSFFNILSGFLFCDDEKRVDAAHIMHVRNSLIYASSVRPNSFITFTWKLVTRLKSRCNGSTLTCCEQKGWFSQLLFIFGARQYYSCKLLLLLRHRVCRAVSVFLLCDTNLVWSELAHSIRFVKRRENIWCACTIILHSFRIWEDCLARGAMYLLIVRLEKCRVWIDQ